MVDWRTPEVTYLQSAEAEVSVRILGIDSRAVVMLLWAYTVPFVQLENLPEVWWIAIDMKCASRDL